MFTKWLNHRRPRVELQLYTRMPHRPRAVAVVDVAVVVVAVLPFRLQLLRRPRLPLHQRQPRPGTAP